MVVGYHVRHRLSWANTLHRNALYLSSLSSVLAMSADLQTPIRRDFLFVGCERGHDMQSTGGCNCGCEDGACSVPVHVCTRCGDCDYGDNAEATEIRQHCAETRL